MLLELLSLIFYIYFWMTWLQQGGMMPDMDAIKEMIEQAKNNSEQA